MPEPQKPLKQVLSEWKSFGEWLKNRSQYNPLPDTVTIKESEIHGLGLFATSNIPKGTNLGVIHHVSSKGDIIRTPLGGFGNHSETPNCKKIKSVTRNRMTETILMTSRDISAGEEITWKYTLYKTVDNHDELRKRRTEEAGNGPGKRGGKGMEYDRFSPEHENEEPVAPI